MGQEESRPVDPNTPPQTLKKRDVNAVADLIKEGRVKRIVVLVSSQLRPGLAGHLDLWTSLLMLGTDRGWRINECRHPRFSIPRYRSLCEPCPIGSAISGSRLRHLLLSKQSSSILHSCPRASPGQLSPNRRSFIHSTAVRQRLAPQTLHAEYRWLGA